MTSHTIKHRILATEGKKENLRDSPLDTDLSGETPADWVEKGWKRLGKVGLRVNRTQRIVPVQRQKELYRWIFFRVVASGNKIIFSPLPHMQTMHSDIMQRQFFFLRVHLLSPFNHSVNLSVTLSISSLFSLPHFCSLLLFCRKATAVFLLAYTGIFFLSCFPIFLKGTVDGRTNCSHHNNYIDVRENGWVHCQTKWLNEWRNGRQTATHK